MNMPGEIIDLWIRFHIWNGGSPLEIGYMESYTLEKLRDSADYATRLKILERLEEKFKHCSHLLLPICAGGRVVVVLVLVLALVVVVLVVLVVLAVTT